MREARSCLHLASPLMGLPINHACVCVHLWGPNAPATEIRARCMRTMSCSHMLMALMQVDGFGAAIRTFHTGNTHMKGSEFFEKFSPPVRLSLAAWLGAGGLTWRGVLKCVNGSICTIGSFLVFAVMLLQPRALCMPVCASCLQLLATTRPGRHTTWETQAGLLTDRQRVSTLLTHRALSNSKHTTTKRLRDQQMSALQTTHANTHMQASLALQSGPHPQRTNQVGTRRNVAHMQPCVYLPPYARAPQ